jgi:hypothetical protein
MSTAPRRCRSLVPAWAPTVQLTIANFFAGRIYSGFVINRYLTDNEVKTAEDWVASKCLASTLP